MTKKNEKGKKMSKKTTKRALISSAISLLICCTMLIGTTFAWFTDEVTSGGNKIQSGTLKVDLEVLGEEDGTWTSLKESAEPIFSYDLWEPGYTQVKVLKVENEGTLALKWYAKLVSSDELSELAKVIDVYVTEFATVEAAAYPADRAEVNGWTKVGTLEQFINSIEETTTGNLEAGEAEALGIAFKMQESAGNQYQGLTLGAFDVNILATQDTVESDSFDNQYDASAPEMIAVNGVEYETVEEALTAAAEGDVVTISGVTTDESITIDKNITLKLSNVFITAKDGNALTVNSDSSIVIEGVTALIGAKGGDGINVAAGTALDLSGAGSLVVKGHGGSETAGENNGGSGIDVAGTINIHDLAALTAEGYGKHAFGIGGNTSSIEITNTTVDYAKGGFVQPLFEAEKFNYGKGEPEAGAAIGSSLDGAVITLTNTTVKRADGGSKSAGIGAMYHTGVTINITDCTITAFGGNASAGIGGSRVQGDATESEAITVTIKNSTVNATGGQYGAGIGAGYDTRCQQNAPTTTVTIDKTSVITAQGGQLAAGIGTGHNVINFEGDIQCDTANVKAGDSNDPSACCWGAPCTIAENVGLGVLNKNHFPSYM